jgi:hypothetical protein
VKSVEDDDDDEEGERAVGCVWLEFAAEDE